MLFIYLWLVRLGEPQNDLVESHPKYLTQSMSRGGIYDEYSISINQYIKDEKNLITLILI